MKIVVIDPRRTDSCDIADLHLPVRAGTDVALFNGLLLDLKEQGCFDHSYLEQYTHGVDSALEAAGKVGALNTIAEICGLDKSDLRRFYKWFAENEKVVTAWSQGVNQSVAGTDKVNAIINCHLATGRIGNPGQGPLSLTGQPNAMGGREVGGLANQLASHMDFSDAEDIDRVKRFWNAPNMAQAPGRTAVDLFEAIDSGEIRFVWIMGTNPVVSMPNAGRVREALKKCPTVVVSDCIEKTDTSELAHIRLPAAGWSEKDGTVTNSERRISRQRALFKFSGDARPDWWIVSQVAKRLGHSEAFNFECSADIFREHATLSAFENNVSGKLRDFNIGALSDVTADVYEAMEPFQWPLLQGQSIEQGNSRLFSEGGFFSADRKARVVATEYSEQYHQPNKDYPLLLNTGRVRDHWHTMTRTGLSPRLSQHIDEPFVEVHPADADENRLKQDELARVTTAFGSAIVRIKVTDSVGKGNLFVPMHWTRQNSRTGHIGSLVSPVIDPWSKQPDCKHTPANIESFDVTCYGVLLTRQKQDIRQFEYATEVKATYCYRYELAGPGIEGFAIEKECLQIIGSDKERIDYLDPVTGVKRSAWFALGQLQALLIVGESLQSCDRTWLQESFAKEDIAFSDRWRLLAGMPPQGEDAGKVVCACFGVGEKSICRAIEEQGFSEPAEIGKALKAGTNCGSCIPEIRRLIESVDVEVVNAAG